MANEVPQPERIMEAFTSFPPKLSAAQSLFSLPEDMFESTIKNTGVEVPPGPNKMLVNLMAGFEETFSGASGITSVLPFASLPFPLPFAGKKEVRRETERTSELLRTSSELTTTPRIETPQPTRRFELK